MADSKERCSLYVLEKCEKGDLKVHEKMKECVEEILLDSGVSSSQFWGLLSSLVHCFRERNLDLLRERDTRQVLF